MCGIVGLWGDFSEPELRSALRSISHRGPDDEGANAVGVGVLFGQRRLAIIDLSPTGHQPMTAPGLDVTIIYNGEVYNFTELRAELERAGYSFRGTSDTEVILAMYLAHGDQMLSRLNGIFALGIWDGRQQRLLLARDPIGVKPLYLTQGRRGLAFASEIKALFASGAVRAEVNRHAALAHLGYLWSPGDQTIAANVTKVLPGEAIWLSAPGRVDQRWFFADLPTGGAPLSGGVDDVASGLRSVLRAAVGRQMVADVPVGAFLSGGLDSSAVVAYAREFTGSKSLQCFTISQSDGSTEAEGFAEDLPFAVKVARHLGVDLHTVQVGPEMADRLESMVYHLDEPTADPAALNTLLIAELARSQGIKVLLSGSGGDDLFTGYRRHYALRQERLWSWLPLDVRRLLSALASHLPVGHPLLRRIGKALAYADLDDVRRLVSYFFWIKPQTAVSLMGQGHGCPALVPEDLFAPMLHTLSRIDAGTEPLEKMLYLEGKHFLADHNLNYADKMGMAAGVEIRVPLLDLEVVDYAAKIPIRMRQHGATGKWIFKRAMEPILPHDVIYRPKTGFGAPLRVWFKGRLRPLVEDVFSESVVSARGLFNYRGVRALLDRDAAGKVDATYTIFSMLCIELWCRRFIDNRQP